VKEVDFYGVKICDAHLHKIVFRVLAEKKKKKEKTLSGCGKITFSFASLFYKKGSFHPLIAHRG
jgi:hypothetical protein|tara:strand:+ start:2571 stop:2762 length:192 start_codon:yes stop_codon:yes gene_type:complete